MGLSAFMLWPIIYTDSIRPKLLKKMTRLTALWTRFTIINSMKKQISVPTTNTTRRNLLESQKLRNVLTCHLTRTPSRIKISTHRHYKHLSNLALVLLPFSLRGCFITSSSPNFPPIQNPNFPNLLISPRIRQKP